MSEDTAMLEPHDEDVAPDDAPPIRWRAQTDDEPVAPGDTLIDLTQAWRGDDAVLVRGPTITHDPWTGAPDGNGSVDGDALGNSSSNGHAHDGGNGNGNGNGHTATNGHANRRTLEIYPREARADDDAEPPESHDAPLEELDYDEDPDELSRATIVRRTLTIVAVLAAAAFAATSVLLWQRVDDTRRELAGHRTPVTAAVPDLSPVQDHVAKLEARLAALLAASSDPTRASDVAPQIDVVRQELDSVHACLAAFQRAIAAGDAAASTVDYC